MSRLLRNGRWFALGRYSGEAGRHAGLSRPVVILASALLAIAAAWPLFAFRDLGLRDYPSHLARAFIMLHLDDRYFGMYYRAVWTLPDLGWGLWAMAIGRLVPLAVAAKLFIGTTFVIALFGCFALHRVITGTWSSIPLLAVPFLFHGGYAKGLLGFDLGIALETCAMAWWLWLPQARWRLRLAGASLFSTLIFLVDFGAWALYGIFVVGIELTRWLEPGETPLAQRFGRTCRDAVQAVPALMLLALAWAATGGAAIVFPEPPSFAWPIARLQQLTFLIDVGTPAVDAALIGVMALAILVAAAAGWLRFQPRVVAPVLIYALLFLVLPNELAPERVLVPMALLLVASLSPVSRPAIWPAAARLGLAICVTLSITLWQAKTWRASEHEIDDFAQLLAPMPDGAKVFWAHSGIPPGQLLAEEPGAYHIGAYAVLWKHALVQSLFVPPEGQPLRFRDRAVQTSPFNEPFLPGDADDGDANLAEYISSFDYVVMHGEDEGLEQHVLPMDHLQLLRRVGDFRLYRVVRTAFAAWHRADDRHATQCASLGRMANRRGSIT